MSKHRLNEAATMATLQHMLTQRFGATPTIVTLTPPPGARARMTVAVRAHDKQDFPAAIVTRGAYTTATLRR